MTISDENTTGVETFDHTAVASLPAYQAVSRAMDAAVRAIKGSLDEGSVTQHDWLTIVRQQAAALGYADNCEKCGTTEESVTVYPHRATVEGTVVRAYYRCPRCERVWDVQWSVNLPDFYI